MDDQSLTQHPAVPPASPPGRRVMWPLAAVAIVAVAGAGAGAYFGLRGAHGPESGPATGPSARAFAAAAYDEASHQVVLFGGMGAGNAALDDTWTWDGAAWTHQHPKTSPPARAFAAMAYDPRHHDVVLVGGRALPATPATVCSGGIAAGGPNATPGVAHPPISCGGIAAPQQRLDTWTWDGSDWHAAGASPAVLDGQMPDLGTDPTTGQVILLSSAAMTPEMLCPAPVAPVPGTSVAQPAIACGMPVQRLLAWTWTGAGWTQLAAVPPPPGPGIGFSVPGALASDPVSGHLIDVRTGPQFSCGAAVPASVPTACPLSSASAVAGSSGATSASPSGAAAAPPMTVVTTPTAAPSSPTGLLPPVVQPGPMQPTPAPTTMPAPNVKCCVASVTTWNGTAWSPSSTSRSGPGVIPMMLAGDPAQHEVVAFTPLGTWSLHGSSWTQQRPATMPATVEGGTLVYDGVSGRLLLFGGESFAAGRPSKGASPPSGPQLSDALWAWDGSTWTQLTGERGASTPVGVATPTPTLVPPATPIPASPGPISPIPSRAPLSPGTAPCSPIATSAPPGGASSGSNRSCAVPQISPPPS